MSLNLNSILKLIRKKELPPKVIIFFIKEYLRKKYDTKV